MLDENPLEHIKIPKHTGNEIRRYSDRKCECIVKVVHDLTQQRNKQACMRWDLFIAVGLPTALSRGEFLNRTWVDIDFEEQTIKVSPKEDTDET